MPKVQTMARRKSYRRASPRTRTRTVYQRARSRSRGVKLDFKGDAISAGLGIVDNMVGDSVNPYLKGGAVLGVGVLTKKKAVEHVGAFMFGKAITGNGGVVNVGAWL